MNPEFRRYMWLELTTQRLIVMPAVIVALLWLTYLFNGQLGDYLATTALWLLGALALLWGTRVASESVISEIVARTWDGQRMSSLGPWSMAWAKLFGSAVYVWYGCAILAAAYVTIRILVDLPIEHTALRLVLIVAVAVIAHATSLVASLHAVRRRTGEVSGRGSGLFSVGLLLSAPFLMVGNGAAETPSTLEWYAGAHEVFAFSVVTAVAFATWSVVAVYMLMRLELQRRSPPWIWLGFVVFVAAWLAGFAGEESARLEEMGAQRWDVGAARLLVALVACAALYYATLLIEPKDPVELRRLAREVAAGRVAPALDVVPRWLVTLAVAGVLGVSLVLAVASMGAGQGSVLGVLGFVIAAIGFMVRDAALLIWLNLSPRPRRADAAGFLYLVLLYALAPSILRGLDLERLQPLALPTWDQGVLGGAPAVLQAAVAVAFAAARWRVYRKRIAQG